MARPDVARAPRPEDLGTPDNLDATSKYGQGIETASRGCFWLFRDGASCGRDIDAGAVDDYHVPLCSSHLRRLEAELTTRRRLEDERLHDRWQAETRWHERLRRIKGRTRLDPASGAWLFELKVPERDRPGKRRRVKRGGHRNQQEARRAMRSMLEALRADPAKVVAELDAELAERRRQARAEHERTLAVVAREKAAALNGERAARREAERRRIVYYVQRPDGAIKIGTTWSLPNRLQAMRNVAAVTVLAAHYGGQPAEAAQHRRWAHLRLDGEWFTPPPELLAHIAAVQSRRPTNGDNIGDRVRADAALELAEVTP